MITETDPAGVQPSQPVARRTKNLVTRLLPDPGDRHLTVKEAAEHLGVCAATIYRLCERGELPHVRITQSIPIRPADLAAFVNAGGTE